MILYALLVGGHSTYLQLFNQAAGANTCTGGDIWLFPQTCAAVTCTNVNNMFFTQTICNSAIKIVRPATWASLQTWTTSTTCAGQANNTIMTQNDTCSGFWESATFSLNCAGTGSITDCAASQATCGGCPSKPATKTGVCVVGNPTTSFPMASYIYTCPDTVVATGAVLLVSWMILGSLLASLL